METRATHQVTVCAPNKQLGACNHFTKH